jgi:hypothetical protein
VGHDAGLSLLGAQRWGGGTAAGGGWGATRARTE